MTGRLNFLNSPGGTVSEIPLVMSGLVCNDYIHPTFFANRFPGMPNGPSKRLMKGPSI